MAPSSFSTLQSLGPIRNRRELNILGLHDYLREKLPELFRRAEHNGTSLQVQQFGHGQSNPTFMVYLPSSGQRMVLRKKPPGKLLASAHAVEREYAVLAALSPVGFPVPKAIHLCQTNKPLGTPFYLMEFADGRVFLDPNLPELQPQQRIEIYRHMASVLASLHGLNPTALGLASFGNPDRYCARQLRRWSDQYRASVPVPTPPVERLIAWLGIHIPAADASPPCPAIVHGDYRLDNIVFAPDNAAPGGFRPLAVLDWELATMGNPWADVAYNCLPYHLPPDLIALQRLNRIPSLPPGIPTESEYLAMYCAAAGVAPPPPSDWAFYLALSLFRLLAILAGVQARARQGNASAANAAHVGSDEVLAALAATALAIIDRAEAEGEAEGKVKQQEGASVVSAAKVCVCGKSTCTCGVPIIASGGVEGGGAGGGAGGKCCCSGCTAPIQASPAAAPAPGSGPTSSGTSHAADGASGGSGDGGLLVLSPRAAALRSRLLEFMEQCLYPAEEVLEAHAMGPQETRWTIHPLMEELKLKAKKAGLWNLWLPASLAARLTWLLEHVKPASNTTTATTAAATGAAAGADDPAAAAAALDAAVLLGAGLSHLEYGHLCELMGRSAWAPEVFNCSAPDTGNMEVLAKYGSPDQQLTWLLPLLTGSIRSCFAMTEKAVASSDATNITASIRRSARGGQLTVSGVKWWTSGACDPRCKIAIFMGKTAPTAPTHKQQSMVLVPMDAPGVKVVRPMLVFGFDDAPHGHAEVHFDNVEVPASNLILGEGRGFEIAQGRLGPGRLHHCMRLVGAGERAVELMARRALQRQVFGGPLADQGAFRAQLARCRILVDSSRLLVLAAADALDRLGFKGAAAAIAAAKVATPSAVLKVLDAAIQAHGGAGVSQDFVLARLWTAARTLRIADGPDEVHLGTLAKTELARWREGQGPRGAPGVRRAKM